MTDVTDITTPPPNDDSDPSDGGVERRAWPRRWQAPFLEHLAVVPSIAAAARHAGVTREHASRVRKSDPVFAEACKEALLVSRDLADRMVYTLGAVGETHTVTRETVRTNAEGKVVERTTVTETQLRRYPSLLVRWLQAHFPERYGENVLLRHAGEEGGPVQVEVYRDESRETLLGLLDLAAREQATIEGTSTRRDVEDGS